jgi:hypothetical protein
MSKKTYIYLGPSCAAQLVPNNTDVSIKPPALRGDIIAAVNEGVTQIILIDGYFEFCRSVGHKELLWALEKGIHCIGASSMGALRAAELDCFGMIGVGVIYEAYRDGALTGDDEVAVAHGPAELGSIVLSEALVNVRVSLKQAVAKGFLQSPSADALLSAAEGIFFKDRTWDRIIADAEITDAEKLLILAQVQHFRVDQKRADAIAALAHVGIGKDKNMPMPIITPRTCFLLDEVKRYEAGLLQNIVPSKTKSQLTLN